MTGHEMLALALVLALKVLAQDVLALALGYPGLDLVVDIVSIYTHRVDSALHFQSICEYMHQVLSYETAGIVQHLALDVANKK